MRTRFRLSLALLALALLATGALAARVEDSLAALRAQPDPGERFAFVVVSDLHSAASPERTQALRRSMAEIALLRPELVVATGDLIQGTGLDWLETEWAQNLGDAALCGAPFFPAPGNHDVAGPETEAAWAQANGPLRYSFDRGNCHFVILNSMEPGGVWGDAQLGWLKADLAATTARHVFVFLHHPLWESDPERWRSVHEVLRGHPVRIVFAGHWHTYSMFDPVDGIRYVVLPSVGQTYGPEEAQDPANGELGGYLWVRVDGGEVSYAVVRAGNIFPPEVALQRDAAEQRKITYESIQAPVLDFAFGAAVDAAARVVIKNPYPGPLASAITWQTPDPGWEVTPASRAYEVPPGGEVALEFRVRAAPPSAVMYPTPTFTTEYRYGPQQEKRMTVRRRMELRPALAVPRARQPVIIDGKLEEWAGVAKMPLAYAARIPITETDNLSAQAQVQYDQDHLYVAVAVTDNVFYQPYSEDGVWQADNLQVFFDPKDDGNDLDHHADDYEYGLSLITCGAQAWVWRSPDRYEGESKDIELAVRRSGTVTTYEAAFPAARLAPAQLAPGSALGFNLVVNDKDGPESGRRHWWVELLPGAGTGGYPFPLVRLVLE